MPVFEFALVAATNFFFYTLTVSWTALAVVAFWPLFLATRLLTRWPWDKAARWWVWIYGRAWLALVYPVVRFRRSGFPPHGLERPSILVVNHQSFFDTFFMGGLPFFDVSFAVRAWPYKMFWFRPIMRMAGYLAVETDSFEATRDRARDLLGRGAHLLFFPEGHRSRDGRLGRFYGGAFRLAVETGAPVVPLVLTGTGPMLPPGRFWVRPTRVRLTALPAIDPSPYTGELAHRDLMAAVREAIARHLEGTPAPCGEIS
jgi:1-acyl-sn-glycerol-3-phosphate acyltransferase